MLDRIRFYFSHSFNDLGVNKRLTFFALLSIAAGVAAIVSLQTLSVMIDDTLTGNLQANNKGDIAASPDSYGDGIIRYEVQFFGGETGEPRFSQEGLDAIQAWIDEDYPGQVEMTYRLTTSSFIATLIGIGNGTSVTVADSDNRATAVTPLLIDPVVYPFYSDVYSEDGQLLADLIQEPTDIVVSRDVADLLDAPIGSAIRLNGAHVDFTLRGVVPLGAEVRGFGPDMFAGIFGFYYLHHDALALFEGVEVMADAVYLRLEDPEQLATVDHAFSQRFSNANTTTTEDLREVNLEIAESVEGMTTIMGLVSMLIGSAGIVNTMQVVVRRRTLEVAVLKTLGLEASQVTLLFLTEAFVMSVIGSLAGIALGWVMAYALKNVAESFIAQTLPFRIAAGPAFSGLAVGVLVTTVFGFLPTLSAGQVRPGIILRPREMVVPRAGILRTLLAFAVMILILGLIIFLSILPDFGQALVVVGLTFVVIGIMYLLLMFLVWLVARLLPAFRVVDLKITLRQMRRGRGRGATTLLVLVIGVFSLSVITLSVGAITSWLDAILSEARGNVMISMVLPGLLSPVEEIIAGQEGVNGYQVIRTFNTEFVSLTDGDTGETLTERDLERRAVEAGMESWESYQIRSALRNVDERVIFGLDDSAGIVAGRGLTPGDVDQPVMVVTLSDGLRAAGLTVGDTLTMRFMGDVTVDYEIVGIKESSLPMVSGYAGPLGSSLYVPEGSIPTTYSPFPLSVNVDIDDEHVPAFRRELGNLPGVFALEAAILTQLIEALLGAFTAFPAMVAALGLLVGGVVIANSVALTTMERRREIATMKAIGLPRERVLLMLLLENGILGLIGGLIGVGIGLAGLLFGMASGGVPSAAIPYGTAFLLMALCILVALAAALSSAWGASGEKPLNVLRHE